MSAPLRLLLLAALIAGCPTAQVNADDDDVVQDWDASGLQDWDASGLPEAPEPARSPLNGTVNYVIDGDTFDIEFAHGGGSGRVRVLAIDSTELNSDEPWGPDCWALEAKARAEELLPEGTDVWLTFDGEVEDVYRRLLAYVWVGRAPHDVAFEDSFNWTMVREGQAYTFFFDNNRTWEDTLRSAEQDARNEGLGVWSCP